MKYAVQFSTYKQPVCKQYHVSGIAAALTGAFEHSVYLELKERRSHEEKMAWKAA